MAAAAVIEVKEEERKAGRQVPGLCFCFTAPSSLWAEPEVDRRLAWGLRIANVTGFLAVAVVNGLSARITGTEIGDVSDRNGTPFTPAGYAFSIWGLIYLFQAALFLCYQFLPFANAGLVFRRIGFWHVALCALNIGWIFSFSYEQLELSCALIWGMLACLGTIYARIHVADFSASWGTATVRRTRTWGEYWFCYVPWSLYTSWLVGASLLNIFIAIGNDPADMVYGGMAALAVAAFLNIMVLLWSRDVWFAGVNVWTLIAIANNGHPAEIWSLAIGLAGVVGACAVVAWASNLWDLYLFYTTEKHVALKDEEEEDMDSKHHRLHADAHQQALAQHHEQHQQAVAQHHQQQV